MNLATDAACINKSKLHHCHIKAIGIDATQEQLEMIKKMFPLFIDQAVPFEYILDGTSLRLSDIARLNTIFNCDISVMKGAYIVIRVN